MLSCRWPTRCGRVTGSFELEDLLIAAICSLGDLARWAVFVELDDVLTGLADSADARLAFQAAHPI
jgi:hypothetical protein